MTVTRRGFFATVLAALAWRPWRRGTPTVWVNGGAWPPSEAQKIALVTQLLDNALASHNEIVDAYTDNWEPEVTKAYEDCRRPGDPV